MPGGRPSFLQKTAPTFGSEGSESSARDAMAGREREEKRAKRRAQKNTAMMIDVRGFNDADVETTKKWENPLAASSPVVPQ
jgi:hypothetical protein